MNAPARPTLPPMLAALTVEQHRELTLEVFREALSEIAPTTAELETLLDRAGAARFLQISLAKLDALCRRETDPLEFLMCGDSRRFEKATLLAWCRRQRGGER